MKNLKVILVIIFLIQVSIGFGQEKEIFGAKFSLSDRMDVGTYTALSLIGFDGECFYTLGSNANFINPKIILSKFDADMRLVESEKLDMKPDNYTLSAFKPGTFHIFNDRLIHLYKAKNYKTGLSELFVIEYDKTTFEVKNAQRISSFEFWTDTRTEVSFFKNGKSEFGILLQIENDDKTEAVTYVFDENIDLVLEKRLKLGKSMHELRFNDFLITRNSVSFMVATENDKGLIKDITYHSFSRDSIANVAVPLDIEDYANRVSDFRSAIDANGNLLVSGFYKADMESGERGGAFTRVYDWQSKDLVKQNNSPFDFEFLTGLSTDLEKEKAKKLESKEKLMDPYDYVVSKVIANADGSSILVGERLYVNSSDYTNMDGDFKTHTVFVRGDIVLMKTTVDGEIAWINRFYRRNDSMSPNTGDVIVVDRDDAFFNIIYAKGTNLFVVNFSKNNAEAEQKSVFKGKEIGVFDEPQMSIALFSDYGKVFIKTISRGGGKIISMDYSGK